MGQTDYVRAGLQVIASPFQWCFSKIGEGIAGYREYFRTVEDLRRENEELKSELEKNKKEIYDASLIEEENHFLRSYLGMKAEHGDFSFTPATVIGRESTNYRTVYTLSRGRMHGISENMPVVTDAGLVGYITEVGETWCRAVPVIETDAAVGAYIERTGVLGVVEGSFELRLDGLCRMTYIEAGSDIKVGDRVLTSGVGSVYPRGIAIGEVTELSYDDYNRTFVATVRPYADFDRVTRVMVVTEFTAAGD
jgi:rod shape-determining protein MreC